MNELAKQYFDELVDAEKKRLALIKMVKDDKFPLCLGDTVNFNLVEKKETK